MNCDTDRMGPAIVRRDGGIDYGLGQSLDIYEPERPDASAVVLLWHGRGPNERDVLEPLAHRIAAAGAPTVVPDWNRDDGGGGKHHLTASLDFARDRSATNGSGRVVLAGWSLGANAGLDAVLLMTVLGGWCPAAFVGLSGGFDESPFSRRGLFGVTADPSVPLLLIHGSSDEVVPVERARTTFQDLSGTGWEITLREVESDHAGAIGTVYDPTGHRCVPTGDPIRQELLTTIAAWVAELALNA
jgi:predicted esterase